MIQTSVNSIKGTGTYQLGAGLATNWFEASEWRLIYVEQGSASYSWSGKNTEIHQGDLFLLGPGRRKITCQDKSSFKISTVFFLTTRALNCETLSCFGRHSDSYFMLKEMFLEIHSHDREVFHEELLNSLVNIFLRDRGNAVSGDSRIRKAIQIIRRQKGWNLTAAQMAKHVGLSRAHFNKLFKEKTGTPYASYCRESRMKSALTLMQEFGLSAKETAFEVGCSSAQAFSREFKACFGSPPAGYLKR